MAASSVHHIGIGVQNEKHILELLTKRLGFQHIAYRNTTTDCKWVLCKDRINIVVTKLLQSEVSNAGRHAHNCNDDVTPTSTEANHHNLPYFSTYWDHDKCDGSSTASTWEDSVYEVALEVCDVTHLLKRAEEYGAEIIQPVTHIETPDGDVTFGTIRSCVGNVVHTLICSKNYKGCFLPTFDSVDSPMQSLTEKNHTESVSTLFLDHLTLCVPRGETLETMKWYENCLGMPRLIVNRNEDPNEGLLLSDIGLKMAAMEYWRCAESGLSLNNARDSMKFVIAESLSNSPNQVSTFLKQHGGPGIQHIGLLTDQLVKDVTLLKERKLQFLQPPRQYYDEVSKLKEISDCGECVELLEKCSILLDSEVDINDETSAESRYLMQVFTKPIFGEGTFFLEFLQRNGANGFGAGNISALWRAVKLYMESQGLN